MTEKLPRDFSRRLARDRQQSVNLAWEAPTSSQRRRVPPTDMGVQSDKGAVSGGRAEQIDLVTLRESTDELEDRALRTTGRKIVEATTNQVGDANGEEFLIGLGSGSSGSRKA